MAISTGGKGPSLSYVSVAMKKPSHKLFDRLALRFPWPELDHRLFLNQSLVRERVPMTSTLDQRFSECGPQNPSGYQDTLRGSAKSQKYFHNTINMLFAFFTVVTFALTVYRQW